MLAGVLENIKEKRRALGGWHKGARKASRVQKKKEEARRGKKEKVVTERGPRVTKKQE